MTAGERAAGPEPAPVGPGPRHVVLIGLMGAGKSTVGARVAAELGRGFVDTDRIIEANAGCPVAEIFAREGEAAFRSRERSALADAVASPEPLVIACGGGAMGDAENRRAVRAHAVVVWLTAPTETLAGRVERDGVASRPLLADGGAISTLERLAALRAPSYEGAAHVTVDTAGRSIDEVATAVVAAYTAALR